MDRGWSKEASKGPLLSLTVPGSSLAIFCFFRSFPAVSGACREVFSQSCDSLPPRKKPKSVNHTFLPRPKTLTLKTLSFPPPSPKKSLNLALHPTGRSSGPTWATVGASSASSSAEDRWGYSASPESPNPRSDRGTLRLGRENRGAHQKSHNVWNDTSMKLNG